MVVQSDTLPSPLRLLESLLLIIFIILERVQELTFTASKEMHAHNLIARVHLFGWPTETTTSIFPVFLVIFLFVSHTVAHQSRSIHLPTWMFIEMSSWSALRNTMHP